MTSPYTKETNRLADVIAAIQVMASYKFYKTDFSEWSDRIVGDRSKGDHWRSIFEQHPEFFRLDAERKKASLVWRRQRQKRFDVDKEVQISKDEFDGLDDTQKARISRSSLSSEEISTLIETAISLHSRALEHEKESRWWIPLLIAGLAFVGAIVGACIGTLGS